MGRRRRIEDFRFLNQVLQTLDDTHIDVSVAAAKGFVRHWRPSPSPIFGAGCHKASACRVGFNNLQLLYCCWDPRVTVAYARERFPMLRGQPC